MTQQRPLRPFIEELRRRSSPAVGEVFVSAYEQLLEEGRVEGRVEEARALLARLLQRKFGELDPATVERLESAAIDDLETWFERAVDASTLPGVFAAP